MIRKFKSNILYAIIYIYRISPLYVNLTIITAVINSLYNIFNIIIIKNIVESIQNININLFYKYVLIIFVVGVLVVTINSVLSNLIMPRILNKIRNSIKKDIFKGYMYYDYSVANNKSFYNLYYYVLENSEDTFNSTINSIGELITDVITVMGVTYLFYLYDLFVLLFIICCVVLSFIFSIGIKRKQYLFSLETTIYRRQIDYIRRIFYLPDYFKELRSTNPEWLYNLMDESSQNIEKEIYNWGKKTSFFEIASNLCNVFMNLVIIIIFGKNAIKGDISLGIFTMLYSGAQKLSDCLIRFFSTIEVLYKNSLVIDKYRTFVDKDIKAPKSKKNSENHLSKVILENVSYGYSKDMIISKINLELKKGLIYFMIGKNGCGKSTLAYLISKLLSPTEGKVYYIDEENNIITSNCINNVSIAFQDFKIYNFSILQNIVLKNTCSIEDINKVYRLLRIVKLDKKILNLEEGIHTILSGEFSDSGINFSVGELQRISLCRALFSDSDIIILDEFTSFSDVDTKYEILNFIRHEFKDKIIIIITHDYTLISECDKIIQLKSE